MRGLVGRQKLHEVGFTETQEICYDRRVRGSVGKRVTVARRSVRICTCRIEPREHDGINIELDQSRDLLWRLDSQTGGRGT